MFSRQLDFAWQEASWDCGGYQGLTHVPASEDLPQVAPPEGLAKHGGVRDVELDQLGHQLGVRLSEHPSHQAPPVMGHLKGKAVERNEGEERRLA